MSVIKSFFIAFSLYSAVPVPQFRWEEKDMRYTLCFFPWVGALIGGVMFAWRCICGYFGIGVVAGVAVMTAIPLLITGGFHMDGFMDTMDALHSYQPREKKLAILKDSHIGAFAVITSLVYELLYIASISEIRQERGLYVFFMGFFLSRILSGIGVVTIPSAKQDGLLFLFADRAQERVVKVSLMAQLVLVLILMALLDWKTALAVAGTAFVVFFYYKRKSIKEFGGITGDTAGWFVTVCELAMAAAAAVGSRMG